MPYVTIAPNREAIDPAISEVLSAVMNLEFDKPGSVDGNLNYTISRIVADSLNPTRKDWSYADIARAVAVFECAKLEFYRRVAGPKEDRAITANGDIESYAKLPQ